MKPVDQRIFQFTIDGETCMFASEADNNDIQSDLAKEYPNVSLDISYCDCYDRCDHKNGHFITTTKWITEDPYKPWLGYTKEYRVRLQVHVYQNGVSTAKNYYDRLY
jgi:hypothetical protein